MVKMFEVIIVYDSPDLIFIMLIYKWDFLDAR